MQIFFYFLLAALSFFRVTGYTADFVVPSGTTVTTTQTLSDPGDVGLIEKGGAINVEDSNGVLMNSSNQTVFNQGRVSAVGDNVTGIFSFGDNNIIINSGLISSTVENNFVGGIVVSGSNVMIINSGLISSTGNDLGAILSNGVNIHIINSGTISSEQSNVLNLSGFGFTLSLLKGSNLQGSLLVVDDVLDLNVETGLNLALTLAPISNGFGDLGIEAPFVQVGDTIGVIDPTGLTIQADVVADLSDTILDGIYRRRIGCCNPCSYGVWAQGIGSYRKRSYGHGSVGYDNWQGGFLIGHDTPLYKGYVGIFGGATFGKAEVEAHTQFADINSYAGGLSYEGCFCDTFVGCALAFGYVDWKNYRYVMNNLAPGGVQTAKASLAGIFISPEITLARPLSLVFCDPLMSFTFRYAGLFLGDYREKGSLTDLSVNGREIGLLTTRLEAAFPFSKSCESCCWSIEPYLGLFGRFQVGGNYIDGELLGESLRFTQRSLRNLATFLFGFRGIQSIGCLDFFLNFETSFDNAHSSRVLGEGGLAWHF